jgi:hypothetical protein
LTEVADGILSFGPDIVISTAGEAVTENDGIIERLESRWGGAAGPGKERPYYILSPFNAGDTGIVQSFILSAITEPNAFDPDAAGRFLGLSAASAEDQTLQNEFGAKLREAHPNQGAIDDTGNYYDAVYFLAYALYGSENPRSPTGPEAARGLGRLISGAPLNATPDQIDDVFERLSEPGATLSLYGTLGAPDFDPETGVRRATPSVFCFEAVGNVILPRIDVLRYQGGEFVGETPYPCLENFLGP